MKKTLAILMAVLMIVCSMAALAETAEKTALQAAFDEEMHLARYITSRGAAYEFDTWNDYEHYWFQIAWTFDRTGAPIESGDNGIFNEDGELVAANGQEVVDTLKTLREALVQKVDDPEEVCWYLWADGTPANMPQEDGVAELDFTHTYDEPGFIPFLVPYMLEDQTQVKGNVILIAGGGFSQRCHDYEGDASAIKLNSMGYNAFILQRRVAPFANIDSAIDLQRAVRYLKYYADEKGIAAIENLAVVGFSGGGSTITSQLQNCYGDICPDEIYPTYVCDEIDAVNSDYKVAGIYYGAASNYTTENTNMPALFFVVGSEDAMAHAHTLNMYAVANEMDWTAGLYIAADAPHGFALTGVRAYNDQGTSTAVFATEAFNNFLEVQFGVLPVHF